MFAMMIKALIILQGLLQYCLAIESFKTPFSLDIVPHSGHICALGDVNGDRNTDLLLFRESIKENKKGAMELAWVIQDEKGSFSNTTNTIDLGPKDEWNEPPRCAVGDFDGQSTLDLLIYKSNDGGETFNIWKMLLWQYESGNFMFKEANLCSFAENKFLDEPNFIDINGDGHADIFGVTDGMKLYCRLGVDKLELNTEKRTCFQETPCEHHFDGWEKNFAGRLPFHGAPWMFVDINNDLSAELIIPSMKGDTLMLDVWTRSRDTGSGKENSRWQLSEDVKIPNLPPGHTYGAPFVADFNGDAKMEIAVPGCGDKDCTTVVAMWLLEVSGDCTEHCVISTWDQASFDMSGMTIVKSGNSKVLFRVGDFNLDGFPDLVATFTDTKTKKTGTKVVGNDECPECSQNRTRKFQLRAKLNLVEPWEAALGEATMSTFFDLKEDGNLDILVEYKYPETRKRFSFIPSTEKDDTTFLKVQTYTNVCDTKGCGANSPKDIGSGIAWPGVCAKFEMENSWTNGKKRSVSCQLTSTTHRSLATPYILFGLGRSPNFVDKINLGAPRNPEQKSQQGTFTQLVPNSRIIVVPPKGGVGVWTHRLFVTPSQLIIQSLIVLASVCLLLLLVVIILHVRERKEDRLERLAQSHRFHFDAM